MPPVPSKSLAKPKHIDCGVLTATQEICPFCGANLQITQHRERTLRRQDGRAETYLMRDKTCSNGLCPQWSLIYRPHEECTLALPGSHIALELALEIGAARMREHMSFPRIHRRLIERGVRISLSTVQDQFRNYLSLLHCQTDLKQPEVLDALRAQGGILPLIDGIQFGTGEAVLYVIIDAISRRPLFAEHKICRAASDLVPFIQQLTDLDIPILAVVSDKEKGLVPAIKKALPECPLQFCQLHYLKRVAAPMEEDLATLNSEVRETETQLRKLERTILRREGEMKARSEELSAGDQAALELCRAARAEALRHGRAPFDPSPLKRHEGLDRVAETVAKARQKKRATASPSASLATC